MEKDDGVPYVWVHVAALVDLARDLLLEGSDIFFNCDTLTDCCV